MKKMTTILIIALILLPVISAFSEDKKFEGEIKATGKIFDISGNEAKFNEYRDIDDGVYGRIKLKYESDSYFLNIKASDIGYETQEYKIEGGKWGKFKFNFNYNEIPHNFTYDAKTFYSGVGSNNLTYTVAPTTDTSSWSNFDYSIERKQYGGGFKLELLKPLYLDFSVSREEREGTYPIGAAGSTGGGIALELPAPVDYETDTFKMEIGYSKNPLFASLSYYYSEFDNDNSNLFFRNPATANTASTTDVTTLAPDNQYYKIAFKGSVKLPLSSKFNVNIATSKTKADAALFDFRVADVAGGTAPLSLSDPVFDGKISTQNYAFVLTSNPISFLSGKIFYKYYDKENKSDQIQTTDGVAMFTNHLFDYHKNNFGVELGFKLPAHLYLNTSYNYLRINRARGDLPETKDNIYAADLKWSGLDFMTAKVGYERLERDADWDLLTLTTGTQATANAIEPFIRRFDASPQDRDTYKLSLEIYPIESLNLGLQYKYKKSDYKDTVLGLRDEKSSEFYIDAGYSIGKIAHLNGYFGYESAKSYQFQRRFADAAGADPTGATQDASNYNWDVRQKDKSYDYGIGTDIYLIPRKLTLRLQHDYVDSDGSANFTYYTAAALTGGRTNDDIDIADWDDYKKSSVMAKVKYEMTKNYSFSAGYVYERYKYTDAQYDGYVFVPATAGTNGAFLTGAYKDPSYQAHVIFFSAAYKF